MSNGSRINNKHNRNALNEPQNDSSFSNRKKYNYLKRNQISDDTVSLESSSNSNKVSRNNIIDNNVKNNYSIGNDDKKTADVEISFPKKAKIILLFVGIGLFLLVFIVLFVTLYLGIDSSSSLAMNGYYASNCSEITVVEEENGITTTATYSLDEYVAGVIVGEVGFWGNYEVDKAFAILARSFGLANVDSSCTILGDARKQNFEPLTSSSTDQLALKAAQETSGIVLLKDGSLYSSQYDAFACIDKDDTYYTISQMNQKIPISWMDSKNIQKSKPDWFICDGKENLVEHHGNGVSQYGSLYLASEKGYTYTEILDFYLGDLNLTLSTNSVVSSVAGLELKDTTGAKKLSGDNVATFLQKNGSSLDNMNTFIKSNVNNVGAGTREGVVTAAVSLINYLYDNYNVKLPYYWGGKYTGIGIPNTFGNNVASSASRGGNVYYYKSFDCSGFVQWAIINGGFKNPGTGTSHFASKFGGDSCIKKDKSCVGSIGDLINQSSSHVVLIVGVDEDSQQYMIAESSGQGVIMRKIGMHSGDYSNYSILHMDSYYNNSNNINTSY